jgi:hypothetical protein
MTDPATKRMRVNVMARDIQFGEPKPASCPIAIALRRHFGVGKVLVDCEVAEWWGEDGQYIRVDLPPEAGEFMYDFDGGDPVQPFTFEVEVP